MKAFSAFRATFSLGKHVFIRKTRISSITAFSRLRFRSVKAFSNLRSSFHKPFFDCQPDFLSVKALFSLRAKFSPLRGSKMRKSFLLSENVVIKCENPFMERKHRLQKRKRDYPEKTSLEKTYALIEGKLRSQSRKGTPPFRFAI